MLAKMFSKAKVSGILSNKAKKSEQVLVASTTLPTRDGGVALLSLSERCSFVGDAFVHMSKIPWDLQPSEFAVDKGSDSLQDHKGQREKDGDRPQEIV